MSEWMGEWLRADAPQSTSEHPIARRVGPVGHVRCESAPGVSFPVLVAPALCASALFPHCVCAACLFVLERLDGGLMRARGPARSETPLNPSRLLQSCSVATAEALFGLQLRFAFLEEAELL
uniref:Uncharacterized protein n=1 Tax=Knipowitschia caucasica TaxID=637954 RepID=A0AAV2JPD2_KNICA